jgi:manganese/zinc/iron transport system permease protein
VSKRSRVTGCRDSSLGPFGQNGREASAFPGQRSGRSRLFLCAVLATFLMITVSPFSAAAAESDSAGHSHSAVAQPVEAEPASLFWSFVRVLSLQDHTTRTVLLGTMLLGVSSGIVGTFMLLRRQALVGDVVSHSALPGVAIAFLIGELISPGQGRSLTWLLAGAAVAGLLAVGSTTLIAKYSRIKPDAALATVLGVFFGFGAVLFKVVQEIPSGNRAGLQHFILGSASTMTQGDVQLILQASVVVLVSCLVMFKELSILCFDEEFASTQGWPVTWMDLALMGLVVAVTVIGLQSVGILMVALLITPPTAARFWTESLGRMTLIAAGIGGASALAGTAASATIPKLAGGPTIVLAGTVFFLISLLFGTRRGLVGRWRQRSRTERRIGRDHVLRAMFEIIEAKLDSGTTLELDKLTVEAVSLDDLTRRRSWSGLRVGRLLKRAFSRGDVTLDPSGAWRLSRAGAREACRAVRNHRLWEIFLISSADIAPSHVDRDADFIEHVLDPEVVEELEGLLARSDSRVIPPSPHPIPPVGTT